MERPYHRSDTGELMYIEMETESPFTVNGVEVKPWGSACEVQLQRGDISKERKPGIWQVTASHRGFRGMGANVHFTCPWCSKINTLDLDRCQFCVVCKGCIRHYFGYLVGFDDYRTERDRAIAAYRDET